MTEINKNEVLHVLHCLNRYKPREIIPEEIPDTLYRPAKNAESYAVLKQMLVSGINDNIYTDAFFLKEPSSYSTYKYAVSVKRKRWPEFETAMLKQYKAYTNNLEFPHHNVFEYFKNYIEAFVTTVENWPELEEQIASHIAELKTKLDCNLFLVSNFKTEERQNVDALLAEFSFQIKDIGAWLHLAAICKTSIKLKTIITEFMLKVFYVLDILNFSRRVPTTNEELEIRLLNVKEGALKVYTVFMAEQNLEIDRFAVDLIKQHLTESTKLHEEVEGHVGDLWDLASIHGMGWSCLQSWIVQAKYWELRETSFLDDLVRKYGIGALTLLFTVYFVFKKPMPKDIEKIVTGTELISLIVKSTNSSNKSRFIYSLFNQIVTYIEKAKKDRILGIEGMLLCDEVWENTYGTRALVTKMYVQAIKKLAKTGHPISKY